MVSWVIFANMTQNLERISDTNRDPGKCTCETLFALPDDQAAAFGSDYFAFESQADL